MEINDQRRRQLIELLKETYDLIGQLEGRGLYVTDPLERRRLQKEAADLKSRADEWNAELSRLENPAVTVSPPPRLSDDAQIEKEHTEMSELRQELRVASERVENLSMKIKPPVTVPDSQSSASKTPVLDCDTFMAVWLTELEEAESKKDWNRTIELGQKILTLNSEHQIARSKTASAYNSRGTAFNNFKQYARAIEDYNQAIELNSNDASFYNNRGAAYDSLKQYKDAIWDYDRAIEINSNNPSTYFNRGNAWLNRKQYERAIGEYSQAIELDHNFALAYLNRAIVYDMLGNRIAANQDREWVRRLQK